MVNIIKQISLKIIGVALLTMLLLEIVARVLWWHDGAVTVQGKPIALLPLPLLSPSQVEILTQWVAKSDRYVQFDPVLGWSIRPQAKAVQDGAVFTANGAGMRSLREYAREKPTGITRLGTYGPSFTHGDEVSDEATFQAQLERQRPDLEVLNWGVGGYGTDQAFLRYQTQGAAYQQDIVIIGVEEDNLRRNVNYFRPFFRSQTGLPLTKPRFIENGNGDLTLLKNPFSDVPTFQAMVLQRPNEFLDLVCPYDNYCNRNRYQPQPLDIFKSYRFLRTLIYNTKQANSPETVMIADPQVQRVNFLLIKKFVQTVIANGSKPIILTFPERTSIEAHEKGKPTLYATGITLLRDHGLPVIDLAAAFVHAKQTEQANYLDYYASDGGHFNEHGNYIVGQTILAYLCQQNLVKNCP